MPKRLNYILLIYMDDSLIYVLYLSEVFILLHHIFKGLCFLTMSYQWCFFQPLHMKSPSFMGDKKITLSWMEQPKKPASTVAGLDACHPIFQFFLLDPIFSSYSFVLCESCRVKRSQPATNGNGPASKKGRGGMQNQLVNRAFEGLSHGGRGSGRGRGRGGRGRGWGGYHWDQLESYSTWHRRMSFLLPLESKRRDRCLFVVCFTGAGSSVCNDLLGM